MRTLVTTSTIALLAFIAMGSASAQILSASVNANRGGSGPFDLVGQISYSYSNASQRLISLRTQQPVLCADFGTSANVLRFQPRDPNGDLPIEGNLLGISAAAYNVTQRRLNIESGTSEPVLRCRVPLIAGATGADLVFANGFETTGIDLAVTINTPSVALTPSTLNYTIVVRNLGGANATSVKVREFFTRRPSTSNTDPGLMDGTWSCLASGSASCGPTSGGSGRLSTSGASIPAGGGNFLTFSLARGVLANTTLNTQVALAAAAFHAPAGASDDVLSANDAEQRRVVITNNRPPEINFTSNGYTVGFEDQIEPLATVPFTVTDPDGDPVGTFSAAEIGNTQVFASGNVSGSQPNFSLTLQPAARDANGTSNVTVRAFDNRGAEVSRTISATITPVNDPPTVVLSGANCTGANGIVTTAGNPFQIALPTSASARNVTCTGFLTTTPGPSNEAGQSVTVATPTLAGDAIFSLKPAPAFSATGGGVYNFEFLLNPATSASSACISSSATDNGDATPPNANNKQFRVRLNIGAGNTGVICAPAP